MELEHLSKLWRAIKARSLLQLQADGLQTPVRILCRLTWIHSTWNMLEIAIIGVILQKQQNIAQCKSIGGKLQYDLL